jgi:hypothetical protein
MKETYVIQGRTLNRSDITDIRALIASNPQWSRWRISRALCDKWDWRTATGRIKDMAARTLLVKLDDLGIIELPARRQKPGNRMAVGRIQPRVWDKTEKSGSLQSLGALSIREISRDTEARMEFSAALYGYHYLGYRGSVGENLQYIVTDERNQLLACLLFGSSAWKCRVRDAYIGWMPKQREQRLNLTTNNTRFLILPWVHVPHLASWILGRILRRLSGDWQEKYGHPIHLVETFVEQDRFRGTCYRAANWIRIGETAGRSRQDRYCRMRVPVKDVYVYPMNRRFRRDLCA